MYIAIICSPDDNVISFKVNSQQAAFLYDQNSQNQNLNILKYIFIRKTSLGAKVATDGNPKAGVITN